MAPNYTLNDRAQSCFEDFLRLHIALESQQDLEQSHKELLDELQKDTLDYQFVKDTLEANSALLQENRAVLDAWAESFGPERPTAASAIKGTEVFGTAELLEHIILYLHPRDVLSAIQINRASDNIFAESPKLHEKLSLRPAKDGFIKSSPSTDSAAEDSTEVEAVSRFARLCVDYETLDPSEFSRYDINGDRKNDHRVRIDASFATFKPLPNIGTRGRHMLICQPPLKVMQITLDCCGHIDHRNTRSITARRWAAHCLAPNCEKVYGEEDEDKYVTDETVENNDVTTSLEIQSKAGITVGDIYDATQKLREAHATCPHAPYECHDESGKVCPEVCSSTDITLKNDDPHVIMEAEAKTEEELEDATKKAARRTFEVYIRAKQTAWRNGWKLPSYEEFQRTHEKAASGKK